MTQKSQGPAPPAGPDGQSGSHGGWPMLPPTRQRWPSPVSRWPVTAAVVLLPLVPVISSTRVRSASCSHKPRPPATGTPRSSSRTTSGRYRLMPGDLTTTSHFSSAASPP